MAERAKGGDRESVDRLAEMVRVRLREYVRRLTLDEDLAQDIVQETILEMYRVFGKLEKAEQFWSWVRGIAFNKVRNHYGKQWRRRTVSLGSSASEIAGPESADGLEDMVAAELKEIVVSSMRSLQPRHRAVLTMRCYEGLVYSDIAKTLGCGELGARVLFYRAKKALAKELGRHGIGKGSLLLAVVIFGKLTAESKAAVVGVSAMAGGLKVGLAATVAGILMSKAVLVTMVGIAALGVGTTVVRQGPQEVTAEQNENRALAGFEAVATAGEDQREYWYYYPAGDKGPLMMRVMGIEDGAGAMRCLWRQNEEGNYRYDEEEGVIYLENYRCWNRDLTVWRLPTDGVAMRGFLGRMDAGGYGAERVANASAGLLVIEGPSGEGEDASVRTSHQYRLLEEEYFSYALPAGVQVIDNRDQMHRRGWTYFGVRGRIGSRRVSGVGRMPFVWAASGEHWAWIRLNVGDRRIVDTAFVGLGRPWMGLHTIDTVRRDAAAMAIPFGTSHSAESGLVEVRLDAEAGAIIYAIDVERDLIQKIRFEGSSGEGEIEFDYTKEGELEDGRSREPQRQAKRGHLVLWLADGCLGKN